jgi:hypothetical protein
MTPTRLGDLERALSYLYWSAYHAGHHDTVESQYTDVIAADRFDYWADAVRDCLNGGDMTNILALLDALAVSQANEGRLREALNETAFLLGAWEAIAHIEYCRFCSYSRGWIAKHGHGNTCPLYEDAALQQGAIAQQIQEQGQ